MRIGVVGNGVVGSATAKAWRSGGYEVAVYDADPTRSPDSFRDVMTCQVILVCLPTPERPMGGGITTEALDRFFGWAATTNRTANYVIKSTTPAGYTRSLVETFPNVVHSPEFLTERTAENDAANPSVNVIGYPKGVSVGNDRYSVLCGNRWPTVPRHFTTSDESETLKIAMNSFFAVKVAFFNELWEQAKNYGLNYEAIVSGMVLDGRVSRLHTQVPGPDGFHGFGGKCLPKDLSEFVTMSHGQAFVASAALSRNEKRDRPREPRKG